MTDSLNGSCLCGKVTYTISAETRDFYFCHCQQCRKITGSAFASNIVCKPSAIEWLSGSELIKHFDLPDRQFTKVFCTECGSGLPYINISKTALVIPAGSLDTDSKILPASNIFWDDRSNWYEEGIDAKKCGAYDE